jgi:hypothetical protein
MVCSTNFGDPLRTTCNVRNGEASYGRSRIFGKRRFPNRASGSQAKEKQRAVQAFVRFLRAVILLFFPLSTYLVLIWGIVRLQGRLHTLHLS